MAIDTIELVVRHSIVPRPRRVNVTGTGRQKPRRRRLAAEAAESVSGGLIRHQRRSCWLVSSSLTPASVGRPARQTETVTVWVRDGPAFDITARRLGLWIGHTVVRVTHGHPLTIQRRRTLGAADSRTGRVHLGCYIGSRTLTVLYDMGIPRGAHAAQVLPWAGRTLGAAPALNSAKFRRTLGAAFPRRVHAHMLVRVPLCTRRGTRGMPRGWRTLGAAGRGGDPKAADLDALAADVVQAPAPVMARSLHLLMVLPRHA